MSIDAVVYAQDTDKMKKGEFGSIKNHPRGWGSAIVLPLAIRLTVTDIDLEQVKHYGKPWMFDVDYNVLVHNPLWDGYLDAYRIEVFAVNSSVSGKGVLTQNMIEAFLSTYNMEFHSATINSIKFDFEIYQTSISGAVLGLSLLEVLFSEIAYDFETGDHTVRADYSAHPNLNAEKAQRVVGILNAEIISNESNIITYKFNRSDVLSLIKPAFLDKIQRVFEKKIYYIEGDKIDEWIAAGGIIVTTKSEVLPFIVNKLEI